MLRCSVTQRGRHVLEVCCTDAGETTPELRARKLYA